MVSFYFESAAAIWENSSHLELEMKDQGKFQAACEKIAVGVGGYGRKFNTLTFIFSFLDSANFFGNVFIRISHSEPVCIFCKEKTL